MKSIGVVGATGMIGTPVTRQLASAGLDITVLARDTQKAASLFPGTKVTAIDLHDPRGLAAALRGLDILYVSLGVSPTEKANEFHAETDGLRALASAAREAGVGRLVLLSSLIQRHPTSKWWVLGVKREAVEIVRSSKIPYTIFYPSNFMENFPNRNLRGKSLGLVGKAKYPSWWIAAADYGRQVANHLRAEPVGNHEFVVQGPEALHAEAAATIFIANYKSAPLKLSYAPVSVMRVISLFAPAISYVLEISKVINTYPEKFEADSTWASLGRPETTLATYAASLG